MELEWTGERMVTGYDSFGSIEHLHRYAFARGIINPNHIVLDIACGEGYGTNLLSNHCKRIYGVDISIEAIDHAKNKYKNSNIEFINASAFELPLDNESIDLVVSFETLEHLLEQDLFIIELKRILKPNGILIISTPDKLYYKEDKFNPFHVKELTFNELDVLIARHFSKINYYFQKNIYGTLIYSSSNKQLVNESRGSFDYLYDDGVLGASEFVIAVASNQDFDVNSISNSYFSARNIYNKELQNRQDRINALNSIVRSRKFRIVNKLLRIINMGFK